MPGIVLENEDTVFSCPDSSSADVNTQVKKLITDFGQCYGGGNKQSCDED